VILGKDAGFPHSKCLHDLKIYVLQQIVGIRMGTNYAPLAGLVFFPLLGGMLIYAEKKNNQSLMFNVRRNILIINV
jgi:hypothetical protein